MSRSGEIGFYPKSKGDGPLASKDSFNTDLTPKNFNQMVILSDHWTPTESARVLLCYIVEPRQKLNTFVAKLSNLLFENSIETLN